jgi:hypothetical protein
MQMFRPDVRQLTRRKPPSANELFLSSKVNVMKRLLKVYAYAD